MVLNGKCFLSAQVSADFCVHRALSDSTAIRITSAFTATIQCDKALATVCPDSGVQINQRSL